MRAAASLVDIPRVQGGAPSPRGEQLGTFEILRRWQTYLEVSGEASPATRRQYRRYVIAFLADVLVELPEVTEDHVVAFLASMTERGEMRGQTVKALKSLYRFAGGRGLLDPATVSRLRIRRHQPGPVEALEPEELDRLLAAAERIDPRARPALELAYATGARLASLCAVMPSDVHADSITFTEAKGQRPYAVPLGSRGRAAADRLQELIRYQPRTASGRRPTLVGVGPGRVWQWANMAALRAGVKASPHTLRRTFGTRLAANPDVDLRTWVELMGHADGSQLRRYAKPSDERLRSAVEGL